MTNYITLLISVLFYTHTYAQDINITVGDVTATSALVGSELLIILTKEPFIVSAPVEFSGILTDSNTTLYYSISINDKIKDSGWMVLNEGFPPSIESDEISTDETGDTIIKVNVWFDDSDIASEYMESFAITGFTTMVPLIFIIFFAVTVKNVYVSLFLGIWIGSFIISACSFRYAFEMSVGTYILGSAASEEHQFVILFTVFLSGLVFLIQRSGGTEGFSAVISRLAKTGKRTQFACFLAGLMFFFDDYANALVVGTTFQPLTDMFHISREKLAFLVDGTSAPDASIVPLSSWIGFELQQIQEQLDLIKINNGGIMPDGLTDNAFVFFVVTIPTRFYPIYMLVFQFMLMALAIEFGPMLISERLCRINKRTDGGRGSVANSGTNSEEDEELTLSGAEPAKDTPGRWWNMVVPIVTLVIFILAIIINTGVEAIESDPDTSMNARNIFANSDPWGSLLYGTFGASVFTIAFLMIQFKQNGNIVPPSLLACKNLFFKPKKEDKNDNNNDNDNIAIPKPLIRFPEAIETWINGIAFMSPAVAILILVWAIGTIMTDIGADRYFTRIISDDISANNLPTLVFIMAALLSAATGTSWGTMTIMFPLVSPAAWSICQGLDNGVELYTITLSQILSGSIFGDHSSPLSDTTLLSSVASGCDLFRHVTTQMPYAIWVAWFSVITGTLMVGNGVSTGGTLVVGIIIQTLCTFLIGAPVIAKNGRYDIFTEIYIICLDKCKCCKNKEQIKEDRKEETELILLKQETIVFVQKEQTEDIDLLMKFLELTKLIILFQKCGFGVHHDKTMTTYNKHVSAPLTNDNDDGDNEKLIEEEKDDNETAGNVDGTHPDDDLL